MCRDAAEYVGGCFVGGYLGAVSSSTFRHHIRIIREKPIKPSRCSGAKHRRPYMESEYRVDGLWGVISKSERAAHIYVHRRKASTAQCG
jgi:hypothetical protein